MTTTARLTPTSRNQISTRMALPHHAEAGRAIPASRRRATPMSCARSDADNCDQRAISDRSRPQPTQICRVGCSVQILVHGVSIDNGVGLDGVGWLAHRAFAGMLPKRQLPSPRWGEYRLRDMLMVAIIP